MQELTPKGRATRARILEAAVRRFAEDGYEATTLRAIARDAGVSPGLAYRYVESKEALVLGLYEQLAAAFADEVGRLDDGPWVVRATAALDTSLRLLQPHRETLGALMGAMLTRRGDAIYIPFQTSQRAVRDGFVEAIGGADNAPADAQWLGETVYLAHLGLLLFWLLDRSEGQRATRRLRDASVGFAPWVARLRHVPGVGAAMRSFVGIVREGIYGAEEADAG